MMRPPRRAPCPALPPGRSCPTVPTVAPCTLPARPVADGHRPSVARGGRRDSHLPAGPRPGGGGPARHGGTPVAAALALLAALALAACLPDRAAAPPPSPYPGAEGFGPQRIAAERTACAARGGRFAAGGRAGRLVCFTTPRDAGRSCTRPADCEVACLARSRSCAPVAPLFGCHEVVQADGSVATLCLD